MPLKKIQKQRNKTKTCIGWNDLGYKHHKPMLQGGLTSRGMSYFAWTGKMSGGMSSRNSLVTDWMMTWRTRAFSLSLHIAFLTTDLGHRWDLLVIMAASGNWVYVITYSHPAVEKKNTLPIIGVRVLTRMGLWEPIVEFSGILHASY